MMKSFARLCLCLALLAAVPVWPAVALQVIADIAPVHSLVARVMTGAGQPVLLIPRQTAPETFTPVAADLTLLARADAVFVVGSPLSPGLMRPLQQIPRRVYVVELSEVPGLPLPRRRQPLRTGLADSPYFWLNPDVAQIWLEVIADVLGEIDPANAARYRENAAAGVAELTRMSSGIAGRLRPLLARPYVALGTIGSHFEHRFQLRPEARIADAGPQPAERDALLLKQLETAQAGCLEVASSAPPQPDPDWFAERGIRLVRIDPFGDGLAPGPRLYAELVERLARDFEHCLATDGDRVAE